MPGNKLFSINPYNEEVLAEFEYDALSDIQKWTQGLYENMVWPDKTVAERSDVISDIARILESEKDELSNLMTLEMGKCITESIAEVEKCIWMCEYFSENAQASLEPEQVKTDFRASYVRFDALGVVLAVMPWNFPLWQVLRCAIPALLVGNRVLLKHASNVPQMAAHIEKLLSEALPDETFRNVFIPGNEIAKLIASPYIQAVSFTGSTKAGASVAESAGRNIKKHVLELGGSDPFIVLSDADIELAAENAVKSRFLNSGESCIAAKRIIVVESVSDAFIQAVLKNIESLQAGDPLDESTDIAPLAKKSILDTIVSQLADAKKKGANVILGGKRIGDTGYLFEPTLVTEVNEDMAILQEETFGPLMPIHVLPDEDEVIRAANRTDFGLGASIWSQDIARAEHFSRRIEAGFVAINDIVKSDPRLPFGGVKKSGYGRELSKYGLKEFANIKSVVVK